MLVSGVFHKNNCLSAPPEAIIDPSGLNREVKTKLEWPSSTSESLSKDEVRFDWP